MPRGKSYALKLWILICGAAILVSPLLGQTFYGSVAGTVTDASSANIVGAKVTITSNGTGERRVADSGSDGSYRFVNLIPGNYKIDVEQTGFKHYTRDAIAVNVEAALRVDVAMQI